MFGEWEAEKWSIYNIRFFQMHEDLNIEYPSEVNCLLDKESDTYSCQLPLASHAAHTLYLHVASTFGLYLRQTSQHSLISAHSALTLTFAIKSTNIISHNREFIELTLSPSKLANLCALSSAQRVRVALKFTENFVDDPVIEALVAEDARNLLNEGYNEMWAGRLSQARIRFEESFQLLRRCEDELFRMAYCSYGLQDWAACLRDIETALLLHPHNARYLLLKVKALVALYGESKGWEGEILEECLKTATTIELEKIADLDPNERNELKALIAKLEQSPLLNRTRMLKKTLIANALAKYDTTHPISKWFPSKTELSHQLRQILLSEEVEENATPEEVTDPISYEIMSNPVIVESGHSFDEKTLQEYFKKNGFRDPITRRDTYPQFVFYNLNLREYIREHPRLRLWRQYEQELLRK